MTTRRAPLAPSILLALIVALLLAVPAAAASRCDNPADLPVVTVGSTTFTTGTASAPATLASADAHVLDVLVDAGEAPAALFTAEVDWAHPAQDYDVQLVNQRGDWTRSGYRLAPAVGGELTRATVSKPVAACETIQVRVLPKLNPTMESVEVEVRVEPHDAAPTRDLAVDPGDVTVIAMIEDGFNPYHHEFRADLMPGGDRLPLDRAPHEWISGFPDPDQAFSDYRALDLTLPDDPDASVPQTRAADDAVWASTSRSEPDAVSYHWVPGTKYVGAVDFSGQWQTEDNADPVSGQPRHDLNNLHGSRTTSTAAGNTVGACPECVIVMVVTHQQDPDRHAMALRWATDQAWIDVVIDQTTVPDEHAVNRGPVFAPTASGIDLDVDVEQSRAAHVRGQQHFFAGFNGMANAFVVPNNSMFAHNGLDWVTTVTGVGDAGQPISGTTRGADVAAVAENVTVTDGETMSSLMPFAAGTSFSAPTVGGTYARSLALVRDALPGPSRMQADGVIAAGPARRCGGTAACPVDDGVLTRDELLHHLHASARLTAVDTLLISAGGLGIPTSPPRTPFDRDNAITMLGHGVIGGRDFGDVAWHDAVDAIVAPVLGERPALPIPADVIAHQTVDSYCRQQWWGDWDEGYYQRGTTVLPGPDTDRPQRSAMEAACTAMVAPVGGMRLGDPDG